jgi:RNase P subunit RPR2
LMYSFGRKGLMCWKVGWKGRSCKECRILLWTSQSASWG